MDVEVAGHIIQSAVITSARRNPNFTNPVKYIDLVSPGGGGGGRGGGKVGGSGWREGKEGVGDGGVESWGWREGKEGE